MNNFDSEIIKWVRITKGDLPGHEFRGNQWSKGAGSLATQAKGLARAGESLSPSEKVAQHEALSQGHANLAEQHAKIAEELRSQLAPIPTPGLDNAIQNLKDVRSGKNAPNALPAEALGLSGLGGTSSGGMTKLVVALNDLASATPNSPKEQKALDKASSERDNVVGSLVATAQSLQDVVRGEHFANAASSENLDGIAPQDKVALFELGERLGKQALEVMDKTTGIGLHPPHSVELFDRPFCENAGTLTYKDGSKAPNPLYSLDKNTEEIDNAISKLDDASKSKLDKEAMSDIGGWIPSEYGYGSGRGELAPGTSVPILKAPSVSADHNGYPNSYNSFSDDGSRPLVSTSFWKDFLELNKGSLQPETVNSIQQEIRSNAGNSKSY